MCLMTAKPFGAPSFLTRPSSSRKVMAGTRCGRFPMTRCGRTACANRPASRGGDGMKCRVSTLVFPPVPRVQTTRPMLARCHERAWFGLRTVRFAGYRVSTWSGGRRLRHTPCRKVLKEETDERYTFHEERYHGPHGAGSGRQQLDPRGRGSGRTRPGPALPGLRRGTSTDCRGGSGRRGGGRPAAAVAASCWFMSPAPGGSGLSFASRARIWRWSSATPRALRSSSGKGRRGPTGSTPAGWSVR